jgi:hypothetical protein
LAPGKKAKTRLATLPAVLRFLFEEMARWREGSDRFLRPDGLFFKPKIQIWVNFEGFAKEDVGIFY